MSFLLRGVRWREFSLACLALLVQFCEFCSHLFIICVIIVYFGLWCVGALLYCFDLSGFIYYISLKFLPAGLRIRSLLNVSSILRFRSFDVLALTCWSVVLAAVGWR